jgi:hypothetical protein
MESNLISIFTTARHLRQLNPLHTIILYSHLFKNSFKIFLPYISRSSGLPDYDFV